MRQFPIFLSLQGTTALVLGTGETAERRAAGFAAAGAQVRRATQFSPGLLEGCAIAAGAGAPLSELQALSTAARARGVPVNIVDHPALCSYFAPSVVERDPLVIAVGSGGAAPFLARLLRSRIEALVSPRFADLGKLAARFAGRMRAAVPDLAQRRQLMERTLGGRVGDLVLAGQDSAAEAELAAEIEAASEGTSRPAAGIVYLAGAGPGAGDLVTLRGQRVLTEADVVVHDRLVSPEVLALARRDARFIYVGKQRGRHSLPQGEINQLLVALAREGLKVVRLKGGDPFIFGRGGEEMEALAAAGIACEVVPGITAALACAAGAGIPLTHRDVARAVTFVTGHTKAGGQLDLDFAALAGLRGTLAVYMGLGSLGLLCDGLIAAGMPPAMPAAVIERGGTAAQRSLSATVATIAARTQGWSTGGPLLVLVGQVVDRAPMQKE